LVYLVKIIDKQIIDFKIEDKNDENWRCSPRYDLKVLVNDITDEDLEKWKNFWFKKYRKNISNFIKYYINDFSEDEEKKS
jgi:hypothetical protein